MAVAGQVSAGKIDDHMRGARNLAIHPYADTFHAIAIHADEALRRAPSPYSGKSTTMRAGDSIVDTFGVNVPLALNSTRNPPWLCSTSSRCNRALAATSLPSCHPQPRSLSPRTPAAEPRDPAVAFAFPYLPIRGAFASMCFFKVFISRPTRPGCNLFNHFSPKTLTQAIL